MSPETPLDVTCNGSGQVLTPDPSIWADQFMITAPDTNAGTIFIGKRNADGTVPSSISFASKNVLYSLPPGSSVPLKPNQLANENGQQMQLAAYCCQGTANDNLAIAMQQRF